MTYAQASEILDGILGVVSSHRVVLKVLEQIPFVFWIKNDKLEMVYLTPLYEQKYLSPRGYSREDYLGNDDFSVWPQEIAENYRNNDWEVMKKGEPYVFEETVIVKGKEIKETFVKWVLMIDGKKYYAGQQIGGDISIFINAFHDLKKQPLRNGDDNNEKRNKN